MENTEKHGLYKASILKPPPPMVSKRRVHTKSPDAKTIHTTRTNVYDIEFNFNPSPGAKIREHASRARRPTGGGAINHRPADQRSVEHHGECDAFEAADNHTHDRSSFSPFVVRHAVRAFGGTLFGGVRMPIDMPYIVATRKRSKTTADGEMRRG